MSEQDVIFGIRHCVNEAAKLFKAQDGKIKDTDYYEAKAEHDLTRPAVDGAKANSAFTFKDYAPVVFHKIREAFGVTPEDFLESWQLDPTIKLEQSTARSGSMFYRTKDNKFLFKTILHPEVGVMMALLEDYLKHITEQPKTLVVKIYGLFRFRTGALGSDKMWVLIMGNSFPPGLTLSDSYDLKGRVPKEGKAPHERQPVTKAGTPKKDNEITRYLQFYDEEKAFFLKQLKADVELLKKNNIMDYSLLIGIYRLNEKELAYEAQCKKAGAVPGSIPTIIEKPTKAIETQTSTPASVKSSKSSRSSDKNPKKKVDKKSSSSSSDDKDKKDTKSVEKVTSSKKKGDASGGDKSPASPRSGSPKTKHNTEKGGDKSPSPPRSGSSKTKTAKKVATPLTDSSTSSSTEGDGGAKNGKVDKKETDEKTTDKKDDKTGKSAKDNKSGKDDKAGKDDKPKSGKDDKAHEKKDDPKKDSKSGKSDKKGKGSGKEEVVDKKPSDDKGKDEAKPKEEEKNQVEPSFCFQFGGLRAYWMEGETKHEEIIYLGIIDNLTAYNFNKKVAHFCKKRIWESETLSTVRAEFYADRFLDWTSGKLLGEKVPLIVREDPKKKKADSKKHPKSELDAKATASRDDKSKGEKSKGEKSKGEKSKGEKNGKSGETTKPADDKKPTEKKPDGDKKPKADSSKPSSKSESQKKPATPKDEKPVSEHQKKTDDKPSPKTDHKKPDSKASSPKTPKKAPTPSASEESSSSDATPPPPKKKQTPTKKPPQPSTSSSGEAPSSSSSEDQSPPPPKKSKGGK